MRYVFFGVLWMSLSMQAQSAETAQGYVGGAGSGVNYRVILQHKGGKVTTKLCPNKVGDSLSSYKRTLVTVRGNRKKKCFEVASFTIDKTPKGNDPIFGKVAQKDSLYQVVAKGKTYTIEHPPSRLRASVGKEVVVDLAKSISDTGKKNGYYNVMFFAIAP